VKRGFGHLHADMPMNFGRGMEAGAALGPHHVLSIAGDP